LMKDTEVEPEVLGVVPIVIQSEESTVELVALVNTSVLVQETKLTGTPEIPTVVVQTDKQVVETIATPVNISKHIIRSAETMDTVQMDINEAYLNAKARLNDVKASIERSKGLKFGNLRSKVGKNLKRLQ